MSGINTPQGDRIAAVEQVAPQLKMLTESGRVLAVDDDALMVETLAMSSCQSCATRAGCGQYALNSFMPERRNHLRVPLGEYQASDFAVGDYVQVAIPEGTVLKSALLVYMLPIVMMLIFALLADSWSAVPLEGDLAGLIGAVLGLGLGFLFTRLHALKQRNSSKYQPHLLGHSKESCFNPK